MGTSPLLWFRAVAVCKSKRNGVFSEPAFPTLGRVKWGAESLMR